MIIRFFTQGLTNVSPFFIFILLISDPTFGKESQKPPRSSAQTISLKMTFEGDLNESYQFSGRLGEYLLGVPEKASSACENKSLFRQVIYREKKSLELWIDLLCTIQGQKVQLKPDRIFVDIKTDPQTTQLAAFTEVAKKIQLRIEDVLIKPPKLK